MSYSINYAIDNGYDEDILLSLVLENYGDGDLEPFEAFNTALNELESIGKGSNPDNWIINYDL